MGSTTARDIAQSVALESLRLDVALEYHLTCNHYPPLPRSLIPVARLVIDNYNAGIMDDITLPDGITFKGKTTAPISECIDAWHLGFFLDTMEDD